MNPSCMLFACCLASLLSVTSGWLFFNSAESGHRGRNPFIFPRPWGNPRHPFGYPKRPWGYFTKSWGYFDKPAPPRACDCANPNISLDEKLRRLGRDNDHDTNGVVTSADVIYDVSKNDDTNGDGVWTEDECVKRWTCAYGDTTLVATYICSLILQGEPDITISDFNNIPAFASGVPLDQFLQTNRDTYEQFNNRHCVNRCLSVDEKLRLIVAANDHNSDGLVKTDDVVFEFSNNVDTDKDGRVTKAEWVARWVCAFGDSGDFARSIWDLFAQEGQTVDARNPPINDAFEAGIPISNYTNIRRTAYDEYAKNNPPRNCVDASTQQHLVG